MLAAELVKAGLPAIFGPNQLVFTFPTGYNRQYSTCIEPSRLQRITDALGRLTGESWQVKCELRPGGPIKENNGAPALQVDAPATPDDPLITALPAVLDARLVRLDDGFGKVAAATADEDDADSASVWSSPEEE